MKNLFCIVLLALSFNVSAQICVRNQNDIKSLLANESSRIAFKNRGGLINGGVCWWHSRLQRASAYLVQYAPQKPRANAVEVRRILKTLQQMNAVVTIPGYDNFKSFSKDNEQEVQSVLENWQQLDGVFNFEWVRGISGRSTLPAAELEKQMADIYRLSLNSPTPIWLLAQIKGITSHSFLLHSIVKKANGFDLQVIDSNSPLIIRSVAYQVGQQNLHVTGDKTTFIPYVGFQKDFNLITKALKKHCVGKDIDLPEVEETTIEDQ